MVRGRVSTLSAFLSPKERGLRLKSGVHGSGYRPVSLRGLMGFVSHPRKLDCSGFSCVCAREIGRRVILPLVPIWPWESLHHYRLHISSHFLIHEEETRGS